MSERIKCTCPCHKDSSMKHAMPCCEDGYIEVPNQDTSYLKEFKPHTEITKYSKDFNSFSVDIVAVGSKWGFEILIKGVKRIDSYHNHGITFNTPELAIDYIIGRLS